MLVKNITKLNTIADNEFDVGYSGVVNAHRQYVFLLKNIIVKLYDFLCNYNYRGNYNNDEGQNNAIIFE